MALANNQTKLRVGQRFPLYSSGREVEAVVLAVVKRVALVAYPTLKPAYNRAPHTPAFVDAVSRNYLSPTTWKKVYASVRWGGLLDRMTLKQRQGVVPLPQRRQ